MSIEHIVLAGGGHSHALLLRRWAMRPSFRPSCEITLVTRRSSTFYSGMLPGFISGHYARDQVEIDLRRLTELCNIALVIAEIIGLDLRDKKVVLSGRPPIGFDILSLDVGAETKFPSASRNLFDKKEIIPVRPLARALSFLEEQDKEALSSSPRPFRLIGGGLTGIEVALALRNRWPFRPLYIHTDQTKLISLFRRVLEISSLEIINSCDSIQGPALLCTGSKAPDWLGNSGLQVDSVGRVLTTNKLQVIGNNYIFASGDCGVLKDNPRPASGVWAVRAAEPLAKNIERLSKQKTLKKWYPQKDALKLIGYQSPSKDSFALAIFYGYKFGPYRFLWDLKKYIDLRFISLFDDLLTSKSKKSMLQQDGSCRGCGAKIPAEFLFDSLKKSGLSFINEEPKDAVEVGSAAMGRKLLQSVDGFPALVSDPWLNGRLTALHASSDLWASGANVISAQSVITLPLVHSELQKEFLVQTLSGIQSALKNQGATLIGGHTLEARTMPPKPYSLGIQISLSVNGSFKDESPPWLKGPLMKGDRLLISRPIGTGVLFAAAMRCEAKSSDIDNVLKQISLSQHQLMEELRFLEKDFSGSCPIHACTDITGFGLLGHLKEMLEFSNKKSRSSGEKTTVRASIVLSKIPAYKGSLEMFGKGIFSSLAPYNRQFWDLLDMQSVGLPMVSLELDNLNRKNRRYKHLMELIVDPQTCGPLLISCSEKFAERLVKLGKWHDIGYVN